MQDWRLEREKSKKRRQDLLDFERHQRRERWNEKREYEKQVRSSMRVAAEEAKSMALESGCTQEEAVVEAAAAAARVVDDESTVFHSANADSDEGSFIDDCTVEESIVSKLSIDDVVQVDINETINNKDSSGQKPRLEGSILPSKDEDDIDKCSSESESESEPRQDGQDATDDAVTETIRSHNESGGCREENLVSHNATDCAKQDTTCESPRMESIASPRESVSIEEHSSASPCLSSKSLKTHNTLGVPSPSLGLNDEHISSVHHESDDGPPVQTTLSLSNGNCKKTNVPVQLKCIDEIPPAIVFTPHNELQSHKSAARTISKGGANPTKRSAGRIFCSTFPSFSDIFSKPVNDQRQKCTADASQRELSKSMQHQIVQYARLSKVFATQRKSTSNWDEDNSSDASDDSFDEGLFYQINSRRPEIKSIIHNSFSHRVLSSWNEIPLDVEDANWNLMWVWGLPKASDFENLLVFQKINRFRNTRGLTRKDLLKKNIQRCSGATTKSGEPFNIMPLTYALPHEFNAFVSGYQSIQKISGNKSTNFWIIKPVGLSRGRGIFLVNDISDVSYSQPIVIQRYIADPLCFMGFKLDLRIYVLVTSFSPLEVFLYKEGLARFGSRQYSMKTEYMHDSRIHLTNTSIQREFGDDIDRSHPAYLAGSNGSGNKVAFSWLWKRLEGLGMNTDALWLKIVDVCRKALEASGSDIPHQPNSFEIFGFDLMFDQNLKCWLIEVNSSPSLGCDSPLDTRIKGSLIRDTIALVAPPIYDRKALVDVCKRRMAHRKSASSVSCREVLESDLAQILKNKPPRNFGQMPTRLGNFERIAPAPTR